MSVTDAAPSVFRGGCHCGAITVELRLTKDADAIMVRACQCGFCTRQGAMTISDPAGSAMFEMHAGHFSAYRFATGTATSLICGNCGVYCGVLLQEGDLTWSVANVRGLAIAEFKGRTPVPMHYEHETAAERIERRKQRWTPTEIRFRV